MSTYLYCEQVVCKWFVEALKQGSTEKLSLQGVESKCKLTAMAMSHLQSVKWEHTSMLHRSAQSKA